VKSTSVRSFDQSFTVNLTLAEATTSSVSRNRI